MAINVGINIPRTGVSPDQQLQKMTTAEQLKRLASGQVPISTAQYDVPAMPSQPTQEAVGQMLDEYGQPVPVIPQGRISDIPLATDEASLSQAAGLPMVRNQPRGMVMRNPDGSMMRDEQGNVIEQDVPMADFANEQAAAQGRSSQMYGALEGMARGDTQPVETARAILSAGNLLADQMPSRNQTGMLNPAVGSKDIDRWADTSGPLLEVFYNKAATNLLSMEDSNARDVETGVPLGLKVAIDEGYLDLAKVSTGEADMETQLRQFQPVMTILGLSYAGAVNQTMRRKDSNEDNDYSARPTSAEGTPLDDAVFMSDMVDSVAHHLKNGLKRAGITMKPENAHQLAMGQVIGQIRNGDHIVQQDFKSNRWVLVSDPQLKKNTDKLRLITDVLNGDSKRMMPSRTPVVGGARFDTPGQTRSAGSINKGGMVTRAADTVKDIFGSIALTYDNKDAAFKNIETEWLADKDFAEFDNQGNFLYSTHPSADRNKLSQAHFDNLKRTFRPPKSMREVGQARTDAIKRMAEAHAREQMDLRWKGLQFDLANATRMGNDMYFSAWIHAPANQRFHPNSGGLDYMGNKTTVRDMINFGKKDGAKASDLFDPDRVATLKSKFVSILAISNGQKRQEALLALSAPEQGALGTMFNAVINYYTASGPSLDKSILKRGEKDILRLYTPEIGMHLADLGKQYNEVLQTKDPRAPIVSYLAAMPPGESAANKNLWDDMFNMLTAHQDPTQRHITKDLTHMGFDDGNQNGIFLQSLFFGSLTNAIRLGTADPSLANMREHGLDVMTSRLDDLFKDDAEKDGAWKGFFRDMNARLGQAGLASALLKAPLMRNSFGKDASMFSEHVLEWLQDFEYRDLVDKYLSPVYGNDMDPAIDLSMAVESTLREIISDVDTRAIKALSRHSAIAGHVLQWEGASGDTQIYAPVSTVPKFMNDSESEIWRGKDGSIMKYRKMESMKAAQKDGTVIDLPITTKDYDPNAAKPTQFFYNSRTQKYDEFNNPLGTGQMRRGLVMIVQSLDGDLVKIATLELNKDRKVPLPVMWVHDSIISTPFGSMAYRNAYNNIAIPKAVPYIKSVGKKLHAAWKEGQQKAIAKARSMEAVGIGEEGDFPSLGALFDEKWQGVQPNSSYRDKFDNDAKWEAYQKRTNAILEEAHKHGWRSPGELKNQVGAEGTIAGERRREHLAVTPAQFEKLLGLAGEILGTQGPKSGIAGWADGFGHKANETFKELLKTSSARSYGIMQMTPGGGAPPKEIKENKVKEKFSGDVPPLTQKPTAVAPVPDRFKDVPF